MRSVYDQPGTSATRRPTAAAALVWGQNPGLTAVQVRSAILRSARPLPALQGKVQTGGVLNVNAALDWRP